LFDEIALRFGIDRELTSIQTWNLLGFVPPMAISKARGEGLLRFKA
jgi:hypothetical protein